MSGQGLISVRLPASLLAAFEAKAWRAGMDVHETARQLVSGLGEFTDHELASLPEPPKESDNPRLSLYVGWPPLNALTATSHRTGLSVSQIVRRLVYALVVTESIRVGEDVEVWERSGYTRSSAMALDSESFAWAVLVALTVIAVGVVLGYLWLKKHRSRARLGASKPTPNANEPRKEADPQ